MKGLRGAVAEQWIKFCRGFDLRALQDGLFVLEVQGEMRQTDLKPLEHIDYSDYVSNYDVQLFNSFVLDDLSSYFTRSAEVVKVTKERAKGVCQLCGQPAPFTDKNGNPYLEAHHIDKINLFVGFNLQPFLDPSGDQ